MSVPTPPVLLITDRTQARHALEHILTEVFNAGCRWVLVREKDMTRPDRRRLLDRALDLGAPFGAAVSVAADSALAREAGAAGVHLPAGGDIPAARALLGREALIGISTHTAAELAGAARAGADYATLSPVFETRSKPGYGPPLGLEGLRTATHAIAEAPPVIALGGVTVRHARACLATGAAGIAVMGEVMRASDPGAAMAALIHAARPDDSRAIEPSAASFRINR